MIYSINNSAPAAMTLDDSGNLGLGSAPAAMTLDANGNLGLGSTFTDPSITVGNETITPELIRTMRHVAGFVEYARQTTPEIEKLWVAYAAAEKLKDNA